MKRQRPPMPPLAVRVQVAERQFAERFGMPGNYKDAEFGRSKAKKLAWLLEMLFTHSNFSISDTFRLAHALDHTPALILRPYNPRIKDVAARYTPHAHDPDSLEYLVKPAHGQKTTGRKPGAERTVTTKGSDIGLKTKFARLERKKAVPGLAQRMAAQRKRSAKRKAKIPQRKNPWPKRKMR